MSRGVCRSENAEALLNQPLAFRNYHKLQRFSLLPVLFLPEVCETAVVERIAELDIDAVMRADLVDSGIVYQSRSALLKSGCFASLSACSDKGTTMPQPAEGLVNFIR